MGYARQDWYNVGSPILTPLNQTRLNHMERGIESAHIFLDGIEHGIKIKGVAASTQDLPTSNNVIADGYLVGSLLYAWDGSTWVEVGEVRGPMGPQGVQGPEGPTGPQGAAGTHGADGATGPMGPQGSQGPMGEQGSTGPQGNGGPAGPTGPRGSTGPKGDIGQGIRIVGHLNSESELPSSAPVGDVYVIAGRLWVWNENGWSDAGGIQGPQGLIGATGPAGPVGPTGLRGPTGSQGIQGIQGQIGPTGAQGIQGIQGPIGPTGPQGAQGVQGPTGPTGPQGAQGVQGPIGPTGAQGSQGVQGVTGPTGAQGIQGATGPTGPSGVVSASLPATYNAMTRAIGVSLGTASNQAAAGNHNHDAAYDSEGSAATVQSNLNSHTSDTSNPHNTTASQVGALKDDALGEFQTIVVPYPGSNVPSYVLIGRIGTTTAQRVAGTLVGYRGTGSSANSVMMSDVMFSTNSNGTNHVAHARISDALHNAFNIKLVLCTYQDSNYCAIDLTGISSHWHPHSMHFFGLVAGNYILEGVPAEDVTNVSNWVNSRDVLHRIDADKIQLRDDEVWHEGNFDPTLKAERSSLDDHTSSTNNPHSVTKAQVGLGNVDNVSSANLRDRSTHTGTQGVATITGLADIATSGSADDISGILHVDIIPALPVSKITSGTFAVNRGGTGRATLTNGAFLRGNGTSAVTMTAANQVADEIGAEKIANKGANSGYAPLDGNGLLPVAHLPPIATGDVFAVTSQAQMLALDAHVGDIAVRSDTDSKWLLVGSNPANLSNWHELGSSTDSVESVSAGSGISVSGTRNITIAADLGVENIPSIPASKITSETFADARIPNLNASKITAGTFVVARIPDLDANKITSGVLSLDRIPTITVAKGGTGATTAAAARTNLGAAAEGHNHNAAGSDGAIQFNNSGSTSGSANLRWVSSDNALDITGVLRLQNNFWIQGRNSGNNQYLDMFRLNLADQIEVGQDLLLGNITFETDGGDVQFTNMQVTSAPSAGAQMSYSMDIDNQKSFEIYSEANSLGGIRNRQNRNFVPVDHVAFDGTVEPANADHIKVYVTATGTSPNREVSLKTKDQLGQEVIISSVIV